MMRSDARPGCLWCSHSDATLASLAAEWHRAPALTNESWLSSASLIWTFTRCNFALSLTQEFLIPWLVQSSLVHLHYSNNSRHVETMTNEDNVPTGKKDAQCHSYDNFKILGVSEDRCWSQRWAALRFYNQSMMSFKFVHECSLTPSPRRPRRGGCPLRWSVSHLIDPIHHHYQACHCYKLYKQSLDTRHFLWTQHFFFYFICLTAWCVYCLESILGYIVSYRIIICNTKSGERSGVKLTFPPRLGRPWHCICAKETAKSHGFLVSD